MNKVGIVDVSPETAKNWLDNKYPGQRKVRTQHVNRIAAEIEMGKWCVNNDAITLINGKLANGQHRCMAIVQANRAVQALVLETEESESFNSMDSGVSRSMNDVLEYYNFQNTTIISPASKFIIAYDRGLITWRGIADGRNQKRVDGEKIDVVSRSEVLKFCQDNKETLERYAKLATGYYKENPYLLPTHAVAFLFIASRKNEEKALEFIRSIYVGDTRDVAFELRERLIKNKVSKSKLPNPSIFGLLLKAYNMYLNDHVPGFLKIGSKEDFPTI